jgi:DNA-directed RNA polymerase specialized sigma24 family protein
MRAWIRKRKKPSLSGISWDFDQRMSALMRATQGGDRDSYKELLYACLPLIKNVAQQGGEGRDKLDNMIGETLIAIDRVRHTYDPSRSFVAWLLAISLHVSMDNKRGKSRHSIGLRAKPNALSEGDP